MGKNKIKRFAENETFSCLIQASSADYLTRNHPLKGNWHRDYFKNNKPLVLELGCGKGEYTVEQAKIYPDKNFIGIDIKGARLWKGAKTINEQNIINACFIRTRIDLINAFFDTGEVSEIWLTFSDPQPNKERKRLTSPLFIKRYRLFLNPNHVIHVKTDSELFYEYTLEQIQINNYRLHLCSKDIYDKDFDKFDRETQIQLSIKTHYENIWLSQGKKIKYIRFSV
jgi:tRNA (guanine-N7-)-methyltransferase